MGSSFEELVKRNPAVKTDLDFDVWFKSYSFLKIEKHKLNACTWELADKSRTGRHAETQ